MSIHPTSDRWNPVGENIDALDVEILAQLQEDGRRSFSDIARSTEVSIGTVRNRVTRLLESGRVRIIGWTDPAQFGLRTTANIHVVVHPAALLNQAAEAISQFPEVRYLAMLTGDFDLLELDVICRDQVHLTEFLTERLYQVPGVVETRTHLVLKVFKLPQPDLRALVAVGKKPSGPCPDG